MPEFEKVPIDEASEGGRVKGKLTPKRPVLHAPAYIPMDQVRPNPWQTRGVMDPDTIAELAESIEARGLDQPVMGRMVELVPEVGGVSVVVFQLAFGHRRRAAIDLLGKNWPHPGLPAFVRELTDSEMFLHAMAENEDREDVDPLDTLVATQKALDEIEALTITEAAAAVHLDRSTLSNNLRVLKLPKVVVERVKSGELSARAAREFLCLMDDDHSHPGDMDDVVGTIARTHGGAGAPDWSTRHVRELIRRGVHYNEQDWRPIDTKEGDEVEYGNERGGGFREPNFNVEALVAGNTFVVHTIPRLEGDKGRRWTCSVKMWRRHQTAATREANKAAAQGEGSAKATTRTGEGGKAVQFKAKLDKDPVLAGIRKSGHEVVPFDDKAARRLMGKRGDTLAEGEEIRQLDLGKGGELTADEKRHLGTRAEVSNLDRVPYHKRQRLGKSHVPDYFPDLAECLNRCTWGATYAQEYSGQPITLWCLNNEHLKEKMAAGLSTLRERFEADMGKADQFDQTLAGKVLTWLPPQLARLVASLLVRASVKPLLPARSDSYPQNPDERELNRWAPAITTAAALLKVDLAEPRDHVTRPFDDDAAEAVRKLSDDDAPMVAALLVVGFVMYRQGERLAEVPPELDAFLPDLGSPEAGRHEVNPGDNGHKPKTRRRRRKAG